MTAAFELLEQFIQDSFIDNGKATLFHRIQFETASFNDVLINT